MDSTELAEAPPGAAPPDPPRRRGLGALPGFVLALIYLTLSVVWVVVFYIGVAVALALFILVTEGEGADVAGRIDALMIDPLVMGLAAIVQSAGMAGLALILALLAGRRLIVSFALRAPKATSLVAGLVVGGTVGLFGGWLAELLIELVPALDSDIFDVLNEAMTQGPLGKRLVFYAAVVLAAPLLEELIFRGYLWDAIEDSAGPWVAWVATSVVFAGYHVVPLHVLAIFGTGAMIGWLRLWSGSIWPCVAAHFVNNTLSVVLVLLMPEEEWSTQLWVAVLGLSISTLAGVAVALWGRPDSRAAPLVRSAPDGETP
jgi:membrane protease YdiL (CAAX protease family)